MLLGIVALAAFITLVHEIDPELAPFAAQLVPIYLGSVYLSPRRLAWFVVYMLANLAIMISSQPLSTWQAVVRLVLVVVVSGVVLQGALRRGRLGVTSRMGDDMLVDLRDRIQRHSQIPSVPRGWAAEAELRPAGGSSFSGDFVVGARTEQGRWLDVAVVDVSGKGVSAGTRSLLLSGAMGALIGAVPGRGFLPAANDYLVAQEWDEGFATAVHVHLDLVTGDFEVGSAGHPPAVQLLAGSGRWSPVPAAGPALGLLPGAEFPPVTGRMGRGDVLLLFTDGMVETRERDIELGIDRLVGAAETLLRGGLQDAARRIVQLAGQPDDDDRAVVVLHRR